MLANKIECPICGSKTKPKKTEAAAIKEWDKMFPALF